MKYLYNNSKFIIEDRVKEIPSPLTFFIDIPVLSFTNYVEINAGTIDLTTNKEYVMPFQINSIIIRDFALFKEYVTFLRNSGTYIFLRAKMQLLFIDKSHYYPKKIFQEVIFEYIRKENLEFYLNTIIPFINWAISKYEDIDLVLLFSILLCKKEVLTDQKDINLSCPYMSNGYLEDLTVKQYFEFNSRVGRDDHSCEYTHLTFIPHQPEEYFYIKLIAKDLAVDNISPKIIIKKNNDTIEISYCSMYDDNAFYEPSREYSTKECNDYKNMLIAKHKVFYNTLFVRFQTLYKVFKNTQNH